MKMVTTPLIIILVVSILLVLLPGCVAPWQVMYCEEDNDCPSQHMCRDSRCLAFYDLPGAAVLQDGEVQDPETVGGEADALGQLAAPAAMPSSTCSLNNPFMSCTIQAKSSPPIIIMTLSNDNLSSDMLVRDLVLFSDTPKEGDGTILCRASRAQGKWVRRKAGMEFDIEACPLESFAGTTLSGRLEVSFTPGVYRSSQMVERIDFVPGMIGGSFSVYVEDTREE